MVEEGQKKYNETGIIPFENFKYYKDELGYYMYTYPDGNWPQEAIVDDYTYFQVFDMNKEFNYETNTYYLSEKKDLPLIPYQLFDINKMELKAGKTPVKDNEIIINNNVAQELKNYFKLIDVQDLIGKEYPLWLVGNNHSITNITIAGINYNDNNNENQVFFKDGAFNRIIGDYYHIDQEKVKYQFLNFIIDENVEGTKIINELDNMLEAKNSHFIMYNDAKMINQQEYQNPLYFYFFIAALFIGIIIVYVLMQEMHKQRLLKEMKIQNRYGFSTLTLTMIETSIMLVSVGIVQMVTLTYLCDLINKLANSLNYALVINYNYLVYLISFTVAIIIVILIERCLYAIRIKKYH